MGTFRKKKASKLLEKPEKSESGADVGRCWANIGLRKTQADLWLETARFRVLDRRRSSKPTTAL